jgi:hypothetical protein
MEPFELLDDNTRLVAYIQKLPYQVGKPLPPMIEEGEDHTVLVDYSSSSSEYLPERHVFMATIEHVEVGNVYDNELAADISADELTTNAPQDEDQEHRRA